MTQGGEPKIAVIVPNRNDSRFLRRCLASVFGQQVLPNELIVVDDQSTDDSPALIRALIAGHSWARLIENPVNSSTVSGIQTVSGSAPGVSITLRLADPLPGIAAVRISNNLDRETFNAAAFLRHFRLFSPP